VNKQNLCIQLRTERVKFNQTHINLYHSKNNNETINLTMKLLHMNYGTATLYEKNIVKHISLIQNSSD
jgi:hypothetical protein